MIKVNQNYFICQNTFHHFLRWLQSSLNSKIVNLMDQAFLSWFSFRRDGLAQLFLSRSWLVLRLTQISWMNECSNFLLWNFIYERLNVPRFKFSKFIYFHIWINYFLSLIKLIFKFKFLFSVVKNLQIIFTLSSWIVRQTWFRKSFLRYLIGFQRLFINASSCLGSILEINTLRFFLI